MIRQSGQRRASEQLAMHTLGKRPVAIIPAGPEWWLMLALSVRLLVSEPDEVGRVFRPREVSTLKSLEEGFTSGNSQQFDTSRA